MLSRRRMFSWLTWSRHSVHRKAWCDIQGDSTSDTTKPRTVRSERQQGDRDSRAIPLYISVTTPWAAVHRYACLVRSCSKAALPTPASPAHGACVGGAAMLSVALRLAMSRTARAHPGVAVLWVCKRGCGCARADMNKHMNNHMQAHQRAMGAGMGTAGGAGGRGAAPQPGGPPVPGQSPFRGPFAGIANQMAGGTCITAVGLLGVALVNATAIV